MTPNEMEEKVKILILFHYSSRPIEVKDQKYPMEGKRHSNK